MGILGALVGGCGRGGGWWVLPPHPLWLLGVGSSKFEFPLLSLGQFGFDVFNCLCHHLCVSGLLWWHHLGEPGVHGLLDLGFLTGQLEVCLLIVVNQYGCEFPLGAVGGAFELLLHISSSTLHLVPTWRPFGILSLLRQSERNCRWESTLAMLVAVLL